MTDALASGDRLRTRRPSEGTPTSWPARARAGSRAPSRGPLRPLPHPRASRGRPRCRGGRRRTSISSSSSGRATPFAPCERGPSPVHITLAAPRIRKPGEEKIDHYLAQPRARRAARPEPGSLRDGADGDFPRIADFSLNVTNRLSAAAVLVARRGGVHARRSTSTRSSSRRCSTARSSPFAEVVVHHPMPLFHMEHCVIAALLSEGRDHKTCGRPCERHAVSLRDRSGAVHPVEADVGCRNTVFHGAAQSAAGLVPALAAAGVRRFRIELVRQYGRRGGAACRSLSGADGGLAHAQRGLARAEGRGGRGEPARGLRRRPRVAPRHPVVAWPVVLSRLLGKGSRSSTSSPPLGSSARGSPRRRGLLGSTRPPRRARGSRPTRREGPGVGARGTSLPAPRARRRPGAAARR